ncbi:MAG: MBL fold metallo-hydrolase [Chitinophagales bacterium]
MAVRRFNYEFENVHYYRFSVYRLGSNVQTVYTFVLDDLLIDTAQRFNRENILKVAQDHEISTIILTHHHEDHSGNVAFLMKQLHVDAYAHPETVRILKKGYSISVLGKLMNGNVDRALLNPILETDLIETKNYSLQPIFTPGHCHDHYCYFEKNHGYLFSGDLYVADKIKYFAPYESIFTQMDSLKKLLQLDFDVLFCSHNPKTENGKKRLQNKLNFFEDFVGTVSKYKEEGHSSSEILAKMGNKENVFYKVITFGDFTAENLVKSALNDLNKHAK